MKTFADLGLKKEITDILAQKAYNRPFDVQEKIIPMAMQGKNIVFSSQTGSGKTLAYSLGFLGKLNTRQGVQMLVLVPTRELCIQVGKELKAICDNLGINTGMLHGGREIAHDYKTLNKKNQLIVGTPGRLIQHINAKRLRIGDVKYLIFDESDQMFDNGFYDECAYIIKRSSRDAQIILSSATMSDKVKEFMENEIKDYELLNIGVQIPKNIVQEKVSCGIKDKPKLLIDFFTGKNFKRAIVFANTKSKTRKIAESLAESGLKARPMNSDMSQDERNNNLNLLKDGKLKILVTTDIASRGLHIKKVDIVVNYDVPTKEEFYIHRIGRAGRVGKKGYALTIVCPEDEGRLEDIEFDYNIKIPETFLTQKT